MYNPIKKTKNRLVVALFALGLCLPSVEATAQDNNRYITDVIYVTIRSGAGNEYRIISTRLKSGSAIKILEGTDTDEWVKVLTETGTEGWIRTQYISKEMTGRKRLTKVATRNAELEKQNRELTSNNRKLSAANQALKKSAATASSDNSTMANELKKIKSLSADAINLDRRYRELLESHKFLQTEQEALAVENDKLKSDQRLNFMFYGAGIMLFGMVLTLVLPTLRPKKRYSEWR